MAETKTLAQWVESLDLKARSSYAEISTKECAELRDLLAQRTEVTECDRLQFDRAVNASPSLKCGRCGLTPTTGWHSCEALPVERAVLEASERMAGVGGDSPDELALDACHAARRAIEARASALTGGLTRALEWAREDLRWRESGGVGPVNVCDLRHRVEVLEALLDEHRPAVRRAATGAGPYWDRRGDE
jgi:hypothetical protein